MAFVLEDRVVETANNPGQGDFELLGAVENNQTFVTGIGNGNTTRYLAVGAEGAEIGVAQVQAGSPDRLLRPGTVKNFDGTTTPVNFTGTVTVACIASVEDVLWLGENGDVPARGGRDLGTSGDRWRNLWLSGSLTAASADLGRAPLVADLNSVISTQAFSASGVSSTPTQNTPPGGSSTGVGVNFARDTPTDDHVQMYFTTAGGVLEQGVWARAGRGNWTEGGTTDWWRFVMQGPDGVERGVGEWHNFTDAQIVSGGANLSISHYRYTRIGGIAFVIGHIQAGPGGGTSGDEVNVNLPFPYLVALAGGAIWRGSGGALENRAPASANQVGGGLRFFKNTGGVIVGTDLQTAGGEISFSMMYAIGS